VSKKHHLDDLLVVEKALERIDRRSRDPGPGFDAADLVRDLTHIHTHVFLALRLVRKMIDDMRKE
jgi:hypothetical protein